jgi:hypothetical protein
MIDMISKASVSEPRAVATGSQLNCFDTRKIISPARLDHIQRLQ